MKLEWLLLFIEVSFYDDTVDKPWINGSYQLSLLKRFNRGTIKVQYLRCSIDKSLWISFCMIVC